MSASNTFIRTGTASTDWTMPANWADVTTGQTPAVAAPGSLDIVTIDGASLSGSGDAASVTLAGWPADVGSWSTPTNWVDVTAGQTPAVVAPGSLDAVSIADTMLDGNGDAAGVTFAGADTELGDLNAGTLTVSNAATLTLGGGASVAAATAMNSGTIFAFDGFARFGNLTFDPDFIDTATVAAAGTIEIGNAGSAVAGALTVDQGYTMSGPVSLPGNVVGNGLIAGSSLTIGRFLDVASEYRFPGDVYQSQGTLSGTGTIEVTSGGAAVIADNMDTADLTFQLDGSASLDIEESIGSGTIDLLGDANTVIIDGYYLDTDIGFLSGKNILSSIGATITGFTAGDTLDIGPAPITGDSFGGGPNGGTLTLLEGTTAVGDLALAGNFTGETLAVAPDAGYSGPTQGPGVLVAVEQTIAPCFAAGTRIATPRGGIPIERLKAGDTVTTVSGKPRAIEWIGHRTVDCRRHAFPERVRPIRVAAHAFGENHPKRPLLLSPDHAVFVEAVLIPIKFLVNGTTVEQIDAAEITYYHLELARHDVVLAEGLPAESYLETGGRTAFENGGGALQLHPEFAPYEARVGMVWRNFGYAPLLGTDGEVERVRSRLALQALMLGYRADGAPRHRTKRRTSR